jgi:hypothetical protein
VVAKLRFNQCRQLLKTIETDEELSLVAGEEKCHNSSNLSLADCFAIAATRRLSETLLTTDPEFTRMKGVDVKFFEPY